MAFENSHFLKAHPYVVKLFPQLKTNFLVVMISLKNYPHPIRNDRENVVTLLLVFFIEITHQTRHSTVYQHEIVGTYERVKKIDRSN